MVTNEDAGSPHHAIGSGDALRFAPWHRPAWPAGEDTAEEGWEQAFAKPSCGEDKSAKGKWKECFQSFLVGFCTTAPPLTGSEGRKAPST